MNYVLVNNCYCNVILLVVLKIDSVVSCLIEHIRDSTILRNEYETSIRKI